jgi:hypothetical protein
LDEYFWKVHNKVRVALRGLYYSPTIFEKKYRAEAKDYLKERPIPEVMERNPYDLIKERRKNHGRNSSISSSFNEGLPNS